MILPKYIHLPITQKEVNRGLILSSGIQRIVYRNLISLRSKNDNELFTHYAMIPIGNFEIITERMVNGNSFIVMQFKTPLDPNLIFPLDRLYHGTPTLNIKTLQPQDSHLFKNTKVVFAGERWVGVSNVCRWSDDDILQGTHGGIPYIREARKNAFKEVYGKGGYLYEVNKKLFTQHNLIGVYEYYSKTSVPILSMKYIINPLSELIKMGVIVTTYNNIRMEQW